MRYTSEIEPSTAAWRAYARANSIVVARHSLSEIHALEVLGRLKSGWGLN
jgi:hypothetical protein